MTPSIESKYNHYYSLHCKHLKLQGLQPKTIEAYSRGIRRIAEYFEGHLDDLSQDQLLDYFHSLLDRLSWSAVKLDLYGLKFFYTHVLNRSWVEIPMIKPPRSTRIPDIISVDEAQQLFLATHRLSYRVFFFTLYSLGLRLGEGLRLHVGDIDATRMRVHIRNAKGNKDRLVPLPVSTLRVLRRFWSVHKHPVFLFPNRKRGLKSAHLAVSPLDRSGIQVTIKTVVKDMGLKKTFLAIPYATATQRICLKPASIY
jgi:site-specific recombinase XerD